MSVPQESQGPEHNNHGNIANRIENMARMTELSQLNRYAKIPHSPSGNYSIIGPTSRAFTSLETSLPCIYYVHETKLGLENTSPSPSSFHP